MAELAHCVRVAFRTCYASEIFFSASFKIFEADTQVYVFPQSFWDEPELGLPIEPAHLRVVSVMQRRPAWHESQLAS